MDFVVAVVVAVVIVLSYLFIVLLPVQVFQLLIHHLYIIFHTSSMHLLNVFCIF